MQLQTSLSRTISRAIAVAALAALSGPASASGVNLVTNGGFETGNFTGWTPIGATGFNGVQCPGVGALQGSCDAFFGPIGSLGGIQQTLATTAGAQYFISFIFNSDGGTPGNFIVDFGGQNLLNLVNPPSAGNQTFAFNAIATAASTVLKFQFRDDPGFVLLDGVQVIPEPASLGLVSLALLGLAASRRRKTH